jgi:hypothetical protein
VRATRHATCLQAVGCEGRRVQVISLAEARVVAAMDGHSAEVASLSAADARPGLLASLATDGEVRLWDVISEACLLTYALLLPCEVFCEAAEPHLGQPASSRHSMRMHSPAPRTASVDRLCEKWIGRWRCDLGIEHAVTCRALETVTLD